MLNGRLLPWLMLYRPLCPPGVFACPLRLLGLVGALPRLRHLELFTFADSVMPAHASMEECEAAWAQLGPLSSSLCSLALSLQVHTANPSPTQYRAMLHQVRGWQGVDLGVSGCFRV